MSSAAARRSAVSPALLLLGLGATVSLRVAVAGASGPRSVAGGTAFGVVLLGLAVAAGWRPGRVSLRSGLIGVGGGAALLVVPLVLHLGGPALQAGSPAGDFAVWALVVSLVACAEEALVRGALMSALLRVVRPEVAVAVAAIAFAALHVPLYGWVAFPLDVAVGVWLGGLRLRSGGAGAPAVAHTVADVASWWLR